LDVRTNTLSTILWQTCIKMFGRSNKCHEYCPLTDRYENVRMFEQIFFVLSYDWPVKKCSDVRTNTLNTILWLACIKCLDVRTNTLRTILWLACIKMFGRSNKYSENYPMTDLYKNVWTFEQILFVLYPMTDLYKNVRTFEQILFVLSYNRPVWKC